MPPVRECSACGADVPLGQRCRCRAVHKRGRRHPGYDSREFRRARAERKGKLCERCRRAVGKILHHLDGDPGNNKGSNHMWCCEPCADLLDRVLRVARGDLPQGGRRRPANTKPSPWK